MRGGAGSLSRHHTSGRRSCLRNRISRLKSGRFGIRCVGGGEVAGSDGGFQLLDSLSQTSLFLILLVELTTEIVMNGSGSGELSIECDTNRLVGCLILSSQIKELWYDNSKEREKKAARDPQ